MAHKKKIILNIDDAGMLNCINEAAVALLKATPISSVSVMATAPWTPGFIRALRSLDRPVDVGAHLCLTSEWPSIRMRPILGDQVPSLTDQHGYFQADFHRQDMAWRIEEIRREFMAQIDALERWSVDLTHIDAHMVFYFRYPELLELIVEIAKGKGLSILVHSPEFVEHCLRLGGLCPSYGNLRNYLFPPGDRASSYMEFLGNFPRDRVGVLALHPALPHPELEAAMGGEGAMRVEEYDLFMEPGVFDRLAVEVGRPSDLGKR